MLKAHFRRFLSASPDRLHFAAHSHHPWPDVTLAAQEAAWLDAAQLVDDKWEHLFGAVWPEAQRHVAQQLHLPDPRSLVFATNTHELVLRLLSCLPERPRVVTSDSEFHSFERQTRRLEEDGLLLVVRVTAEPSATFADRLLAEARRAPTQLVFFSHVFFNSGAVVGEFAALVAALPPEPLVVVDGYHGFLAVPTDLSAVGERAFYLAGGYKYAMAGEGACFLHVPGGLQLRPRNTGWFAAFGALEDRVSHEVPYAPGGGQFLGATFDPSGALVIAPGTRIAAQLLRDANPADPKMFSRATGVLDDGSGFPEPAEIRGKETNVGDLDVADVVITNIHQLQGEENRTLAALPADFFDLILVDEGHHNVAASWELIRTRFPNANIINFSATPHRADGQPMTGEIIYSYPIFKAIEKGYVKRLKAVVLNPSTLRYVRREGGEEIEVGLDEVRRLGETESDFRRSIVSSAETLKTIVDASINRLHELRERTKEPRHKIIASALNYEHCIQITKAYRERNLKAEFVHSKESAKSDAILKKLEAHELDVIVQVRMLGEGFDHRYLSVAAVCSVFANLSPFVQFVGRIMRAIEQDAPNSPLNEGVVVFHSGSNIANRWADFQQVGVSGSLRLAPRLDG